MSDYNANHGFLLGSRSGKIVNFDPGNETFSTVYEDDLEAGIATILFRDDTWWINTFNGIVSYNPRKGTRVRFSEKDGLSNNEANRYSALDTGDHFLVGTIKGLNYLKPEDLQIKDNPAHLELLKIRSYDRTQGAVRNIFDRSRFNKNEPIVLPAEFKELEVDFALTHSTSLSSQSYKYRLDGQDWIDLKRQQSIRFPNLAAGKYELEIESTDFSGNKIGESLVLKIDSKDFFYKTWWFYLLITLGTVSLLFYLLKQAQTRRKLQEQFSHDLMQSQEHERTRIAKELHDSVGQQLTLIKKKAQNVDQDEISRMTNEALEEVRGISRGLYPANLKLLGLSESIEQLIYEMDEETDIFFSSEINDIDSVFDDEATLNFYRFIQECITNVLKHSEAKALSINILKHSTEITIEIKDNGKGFDISDKQKQQSLGLKTLTERMRMLNGILTIQSELGKGTTINAQIPYKT